jgi:hypothetical protein
MVVHHMTNDVMTVALEKPGFITEADVFPAALQVVVVAREYAHSD